MSYADLPLAKEFLEKLLSIYSELTGLSVAFYADNGELLYSEKYWPKFCQEIYRIVESKEIHDMNYSKNEKNSYPCYPGLWCQSQSVKLDYGRKVGTFVVGYRRIKGRENESRRSLKRFLVDHEVNNKDSERLVGLLEEVDVVEENAFDIKLLEKISFVEQFVIAEHNRAIAEHTRVIAFKAEVTSLAHEFLLPLQSVIANAENLSNEAKEGSKLRNIAEDILQQVIKLSFIAENIRGSMLEERDKHDKFGYEFRKVDIYPIIQDTIELFRKEAKRKDVVINDPVVKGDIPVPAIEVSKPHIKQVFFNLIHNAVKYSYTSTSQSERYITIICNSDGTFYCVEISNYGVGIEPVEISDGLIFKSGYRGILARDRSRTGSGVGLSAVKRIVELHNGYIKVESKLMQSGPIIDLYKTTVKVCLPFRQPSRSLHDNKKDIIDRR
ncbi:MAG: PocR ligand-binding domain-containing protein [Methanosarcinales archaeon]|nr:PocR ligand-binding domain-containing protein [Methanosarcinales archaeon]